MSDSAQNQRVLGRRSLLRAVPAFTATAVVTPTLLGQSSSVAAQSTPTPEETMRTIAVSGTGIVNVKPDVASITVGVMKSAELLEDAQKDVTDALATMTKAFTDAGVAGKDVVTSSYYVNPIAKYDNDGNYIGVQGYQVSSSLTATVREIDRVGSLLDAVVKAGANQVWGISFSVDDPSKPASEARKAAVADARQKADELATAAGAVVTGVFSIVESYAPAPKAQDYGSAAPSASADASRESNPVPVSTGTTAIEVDVQVVFEIDVAAG
ncbi:MAG: SIMPL domain-containing protein [Thermomicrobiales bacterium]